MNDASRDFIRNMKRINLPEGGIKDFIDDFIDDFLSVEEEKCNLKAGNTKLLTEIEYLRAENEKLIEELKELRK